MPGQPGASGPNDAALRVLHVVQKYSSGVGAAIAQYTRSLPGAEHHLVSGTAVDAEGDLAEQARFASTSRMEGSHLAKVRRVREVVHELRPDVVHAHSSYAGVYTRLAVSRAAEYIVYTPHCYAFERRDVSPVSRAAFWAAECVLALNTSAFAACSQREWQLSDWPTRHAPRHLVPNIAPPVAGRPSVARSADPVVVGGGRLSAQKDPPFFLACVQQLRYGRPALRAMWLGDGDPALRARLEDAGVRVTGWLHRREAMDLLATGALYLHSARWEGFPLMVAEAVALGVPTVVRRLPCFADVPYGVTVAQGDVRSARECLVTAGAAEANLAAWSRVLGRSTAAEQEAALTALYTHGSAPAHRPFAQLNRHLPRG